MGTNYISIPLFRTNRNEIDINIAEIQIYGKGMISQNCEVCLEMSKEALMGFATYAIRISSTTEATYKHNWQIDPLNNPFGNQPLGFFLTNDSPSFVLMYNQAEKSVSKKTNCKEIKDQSKLCFNYRIPLHSDDNAYEPFEIGFENIARIRVFDNDGNDVTHNCVSVVMKINKDGLFKFGESMLKIAHNYKIDDEYRICNCRKDENTYNMGIMLGDKGGTLKIGCCNLGNVFSYEPGFGNGL